MSQSVCECEEQKVAHLPPTFTLRSTSHSLVLFSSLDSTPISYPSSPAFPSRLIFYNTTQARWNIWRFIFIIIERCLRCTLQRIGFLFSFIFANQNISLLYWINTVLGEVKASISLTWWQQITTFKYVFKFFYKKVLPRFQKTMQVPVLKNYSYLYKRRLVSITQSILYTKLCTGQNNIYILKCNYTVKI